MDVLGTPVGKRKFVKEIIRRVPGTLQIQQTNLSTNERRPVLFEDNFRWIDYCTEHSLGCSLSVLHDQHRTNSKNFEVSSGTDKFSFSTPETISEMGSTFGDKISSNSTSDQCDVEVRTAEDHQLFVRGDANRSHPIQTTFSEALTRLRPGAPTSPPTRRGEECDSENRGLGFRQLCREQSVGTFSILETKLTNPTSFDLYNKSERQANLLELSCDLEAQYSHDVPSLRNILKSFYPFNETSGDVLENFEINNFFELYGISNVRPILASDDDHVFWLEDTAGIIYMWSRVEWSMSYLGRDLREALVNYLFHQDNICYVVECTHEIIPKNEIKQKARELADLIKIIDIDDIVTKESPNPVRKNEKKGIKKGKNKGKKKKKKH